MFDPPGNKDITVKAADDAAKAAGTAAEAVYNLEAETPYYPDTEGGESVTTEEDFASVSRVKELANWVSGSLA